MRKRPARRRASAWHEESTGLWRRRRVCGREALPPSRCAGRRCRRGCGLSESNKCRRRAWSSRQPPPSGGRHPHPLRNRSGPRASSREGAEPRARPCAQLRRIRRRGRGRRRTTQDRRARPPGARMMKFQTLGRLWASCSHRQHLACGGPAKGSLAFCCLPREATFYLCGLVRHSLLSDTCAQAPRGDHGF